MKQFLLETERLFLRPVEPADLETLHNIWIKHHVRKYLWDDQIIPVEKTTEIIETSIKHFRDDRFGLWMMEWKENSNIVGFAALWHFFDENQPELLYGLDPDYWKQGFATEAAVKIIDYAFHNLGFAYISASCDLPNTESVKVMERIGMKKHWEKDQNGKPTVFYRLEKNV